MTHRLKTVDEVINQLGGNTRVQKLCGIGTSQAVSNWRRTGRIPPKAYDIISNELKKYECSAPKELFGLINHTVDQ